VRRVFGLREFEVNLARVVEAATSKGIVK